MLHGEDLGVFVVQAANHFATVVGHQQLQLRTGPRDRLADEPKQLIDALPGPRRDHDVPRFTLAQSLDHERIGGIGLVQDDDFRNMPCFDFGQHLAHRRDLALRVGMRDVDDVQDDVGVGNLLQGGAEGFHQLRRQRPDEPYRVGERVTDAVRCFRPADGRIQGGEERVLDEHSRIRQAVEQRRLAGIGVAGDCHRRHGIAAAVGALGFPCGLHGGDLPAQLRHPGTDAPAVQLDLRLTGPAGTNAAAGRPDAPAGLAGHGLAPATEPGQEVLKLGQLYLGLAFAALGMLRENVQDERGAVNDLDLHDVFQTAALRRRQLAVDNDRVSAGGHHYVAQFLGLARAQESPRIRLQPALDNTVQHLGAGCLGQRCQLPQGIVGVVGRAFGPETGEDNALQAQLPVLNLGDVLKLGRQTRYTAQGAAFGEVLLVAVEFGMLGIKFGECLCSAADALFASRCGVAGQDTVDDRLDLIRRHFRFRCRLGVVGGHALLRNVRGLIVVLRDAAGRARRCSLWMIRQKSSWHGPGAAGREMRGAGACRAAGQPAGAGDGHGPSSGCGTGSERSGSLEER